MKSVKLFCIILFCLGMIIVANNNQRNLATPLSRLWGHWISHAGVENYFCKVTKPGEEGTIVTVNPNRETFIRFIEKEKKNGRMTAQDAKKALAEVDKLAGKTDYSKYQLASQEANGTTIIILTEVNFGFGSQKMKTVYQIDKDGKKIKCIAVIFDSKSSPIDPPEIYTFVDTKTSPEE